MNAPRTVLCKKHGQELQGLPFKPLPGEFGQQIYDNVSMQAWKEWLQVSPRYINTYKMDLQSEEGKEFLRKQMRIFFGFEEGENVDTAWVPPSSEG